MIINQLQVDGHVENLAIVVQMALQVLNVEAAFGLFLLAGNQCLIIGRSITDAINIGTSMRCMGGGGHPGAGSAMIRAINPGVLAAWIRILISGKRTDSGKVRDIMRLKRGNPDHLPVKAFMSRPVHTISPCKHPGSGATDGKTRHRSIAGGGRRTTYRYYNTIRCNGPLLRPLSPRWPS